VNDENACADDRPHRRKLTEADFRRVNVGKAFWGSRTDHIQHDETRDVILRYRKNIESMIKTGSGLIFLGPPGVGKTSAAVCIVKEAIVARYSVYFATHAEMRELRFSRRDELFGDGTDGITIAKKVEIADLLVLDGFNEPFFTDKVFGPLQLEELLVYRSSRKLTTMMTTRSGATLKKEEFTDLFEQISQCMVPLNMGGKNMRDDDRKKLSVRVLGGR